MIHFLSSLADDALEKSQAFLKRDALGSDAVRGLESRIDEIERRGRLARESMEKALEDGSLVLRGLQEQRLAPTWIREIFESVSFDTRATKSREKCAAGAREFLASLVAKGCGADR
jgi:CRISPR/Cas system CSM-associated protein Csm2 small subunit